MTCKLAFMLLMYILYGCLWSDLCALAIRKENEIITVISQTECAIAVLLHICSCAIKVIESTNAVSYIYKVQSCASIELQVRLNVLHAESVTSYDMSLQRKRKSGLESKLCWMQQCKLNCSWCGNNQLAYCSCSCVHNWSTHVHSIAAHCRCDKNRDQTTIDFQQSTVDNTSAGSSPSQINNLTLVSHIRPPVCTTLPKTLNTSLHRGIEVLLCCYFLKRVDFALGGNYEGAYAVGVQCAECWLRGHPSSFAICLIAFGLTGRLTVLK